MVHVRDTGGDGVEGFECGDKFTLWIYRYFETTIRQVGKRAGQSIGAYLIWD